MHVVRQDDLTHISAGRRHGLSYPLGVSRSIDVIYAHPYPHHSRAGRALLEGMRDLPFVVVRPLYELYPDFAIDVEAEQDLLARAHTVVWQHPIYWYSVPPLLKLWFDKVLAHGLAYGDGRHRPARQALPVGRHDRRRRAGYGPSGMHGHPFETFVAADRADRALLRHALVSRRSSCTARTASSDATLRDASAREYRGRLLTRWRREMRWIEHGLLLERSSIWRPRWCSCRSPSRLGLGSVLGYLVGRLRHRPVRARRWCATCSSILHFAEFGVVLMLFADRPRARSAAAVEHATAGVRRRRAADGRRGALSLGAGALAFGLPWQAAHRRRARARAVVDRDRGADDERAQPAARRRSGAPLRASCCSRTSPPSR